MRIQFNDICYGERLLIAHNEIRLSNGSVTAVSGESGSGKSTLLRYIKDHWDEYSEYHLSVCVQNPLFLDELTLAEHLRMLRKMYGKKKYTKAMVRALDLEHVMDQYPSQLSGGEQKRAAFLLCMHEEADLYMLDEPTASLNKEMIPSFLSLLNILKEEGRTFLIFTHDRMVMDFADGLYEIRDCELKTIRANSAQKTKNRNPKEIDTAELKKYVMLLLKRKKTYLKAFEFLLCICCASAGIMYSRGSLAYKAQQETLNTMESNEITVYKEGPLSHDPDYTKYGSQYAFSNQEPFEDGEAERLSEIKHVAAVEWRYDSETDWFIDADLVLNPELYFERDRIGSMVSIKDSPEHTVESIGLITGTYLPERKQVQDIAVDFEQDGVYLSDNIASKFRQYYGIQYEDLKDKTICFKVPVPKYNGYARYRSAREDNEPELTWYTVYDAVDAEMKIAGILKGSNFGYVNWNDDVIYLPRDVYEGLIEEYRTTDARTIYAVIDRPDNYDVDWTELYNNELPPNIPAENIRYKMDETPWKPEAYSIYVDGVENVSSVLDELIAMGYRAETENAVHSDTYYYVQNAVRIFSFGAGLAGLITLAGAAGLLVMQMKNRRRQLSYFRQIGADSSSMKRAYMYAELCNSAEYLMFVCIVIAGYFLYMYFMHGGVPGILMAVVTAVVLALVSLLILPVIIDVKCMQ